MTWKETCAMDEKMKLISDYLSGEYTITELSEIYNLSRKTVYKWTDRYERQGPAGLLNLAKAPFTHPNATPPEMINYLVALKSRHIYWGPRKLVAWLEDKYPDKRWPAISTAQEILRREGWIKSRHKRHHTPPYSEPFLGSKQANQVWCADFKGQFRLGEGKLCYPFTLTDSYSRYLITCRGLYRPTYLETKSQLEKAFCNYGLPEAIRTDNGTPFASVALGGLSSLAVWLIKLGIRPERIEQGRPEQNGRHERFHRTLKEAAISPPRDTLAQQQRAFDRFRTEYNTERPHEALGQKTPASVYHPSLRSYPIKIAPIEYGADRLVRQVHNQGCIKWKGRYLFVSEALIGEPVGLKPIDNHLWEVYFSFKPLGILDETTGRIIAL